MATRSKEERLARLPTWAQEEMARLEQRALNAEREAERTRSQFPGTNVQRVDGFNLVDLPPDSKVRFKFGPGFSDWIETSIEEEGDEPALAVRGGDLFAVEPRAANSIRVLLTRLGKR